MGGGLLELVAHGVQDIYLIGNPQITFFKIVYKRHTNFSMESIKVEQIGTPNGYYGQETTFSIDRKGDLIHSMILEMDVPQQPSSPTSPGGFGNLSYVNSFGHSVIDYVDFSIGEQSIDKQYGEWMEIWTQLSYSHSKQEAYDQLLPRENIDTSRNGFTGSKTIFVPLQFWFCRNIGLALPIIALQYHDIKLKVKLKPFSKIFTEDNDVDLNNYSVTQVNITNMNLYVDYIYLDTYERKKFAQMKHRYLIEQTQQITESLTSSSTSKVVELSSFNHPVKSLYWVSQLNDTITKYNHTFNFSDTLTSIGSSPISHAVIKFNGIDRFDKRKEEYFRLIQPFQRHTRVPKIKYIFMYSFSLNPEAHQPSGTCNFSKIDTATLNLTYNSGIGDSTIRVYALNYNVLRIFSGMGSVAFAN